MVSEYKKVLLIDDSATSRLITRRCFEVLGLNLEFKEVSLADEALVSLSHEHFDLVITDLNMPGIDGYELLKKMKPILDQKTLDVLVLSNYTSEEKIEEDIFKKFGATYVLKKPMTPKKVKNLFLNKV